MTIRVEVYGDSLIDAVDDVTEEEKPRLRTAMREASQMLADRVRQMAPEDRGDLKSKIKPLGTTVRGNVVRGGVEVGDEDDIEKVQSLEFGAVGAGARILAARPFMRPAEAAVEARVARLAE